MAEQKICKFFLEGKCQRDPCSFSHGEGNTAIADGDKSARMCKFFLEGRCERGSECAFSHGDGKKKGSGKGKGMGARGKFAFKVLCPDSFATLMIGSRGVTKNQIEEETGCKLLLSNRDEYYPGTRLRMLVIYGPDPGAVWSVLEQVIDKVVTCGDEEALKPPQGEPDFLGKEGGEYLIRGCISSRMFAALVGTKGSKVQAIRNECGAKVFIDNNPVQDHQLLKVVGNLEALRSALQRVHDGVQDFAEEGWFSEWSMIRYINEPSFTNSHPRDGARERERERSPRRGNSHWESRDTGSGGWNSGSGGGGGWKDGWDSREDGGAAAHHDDGGEIYDEHDTKLAQFMEETTQGLAEGELDADFTISCDLPSEKVSALIGKRGEYVKEVRRVTGAKVVFQHDNGDDNSLQTMVVQGPLLSIYRAHAMLMLRYQETEQPEIPDQTEVIADIQKQMADLQKQLESATSGKGKGKKGKKAA